MQILGKRSRIMLVAIAIAMLTALGLSFALWDTSAVKAASGESSEYANAKVGDIVTFGRYYQTGEKDSLTGEYIKTPIEWIVVDKDERSAQLTLMSKYILASGSYFGNYYYDKVSNNNQGGWGSWYDKNVTLNGIQYNQAYSESTVRAFLNNLERHDVGGDGFTSGIGYVPSKTNSDKASAKLLTSVGYSNKIYLTGLSYEIEADKTLVDDGTRGLFKLDDNNEIYYKRPIKNADFLNRPATLGFYDEAFSEAEKAMIAPKEIAGISCHRWPDASHDVSSKIYVEGTFDKVWLPSSTELNIMEAQDWNGYTAEAWLNSGGGSASTVFKYFQNYSQYDNPVYNTKNTTLENAVKSKRTKFAENSFAMNYSIPVYNMMGSDNTLTVNNNIHEANNSSDHYWTRSPMSSWSHRISRVYISGTFDFYGTNGSNVGVRPCVFLKY